MFVIGFPDRNFVCIFKHMRCSRCANSRLTSQITWPSGIPLWEPTTSNLNRSQVTNWCFWRCSSVLRRSWESSAGILTEQSRVRLRSKTAGTWRWPPSSFSVKVKNERSYTSTPPTRLYRECRGATLHLISYLLFLWRKVSPTQQSLNLNSFEIIKQGWANGP